MKYAIAFGVAITVALLYTFNLASLDYAMRHFP